ncbi:MAG: A/G-specific adenine glycosylase, partial [Aequorivita sp.]|nr:A/G-specific adenine glycosylase [Aequorivita sp.]
LPQFHDFSEKINVKSISLFNEKPVVHRLSHQHLNTLFWIVETSETTENAIPITEVKNYAVPVLIENFVSEFFEDY